MNFPNALTLTRIILIFIFIILAANADGKIEMFNRIHTLRVVAFAVAVVAALTDLLDGYLARKLNQITDFGKLMDPLADKIFVTGIMLILVQYQLLPAWVAVVIISREFLVTGLRMLALKESELIAADIWGKIKTALQMIMIGIGGLSWIGVFDLRTALIAGVSAWSIWLFFLCLLALITIWSGLGYFVKYKKLYINSLS
ncbi:MAG: CDP-diacylglycerol--glycerol-3-phosphate 3-phosphatidyltransferase [Victivallaceae bacterium]|nr:CDP-diacylglycerol--glycerol-3-phosphate 3-phosphatidyltransferase [Victivallaceae bacterium]